MKKIIVQQMVYAALFLALGIILPFLTAQVPSIGSMLLPMHLPVLICGYICGWKYGMLVGLITPILRSMMFSMPPMMPVAVSMAFELAAYGFITGFVYSRSKKNVTSVYMSLIMAMIGGRIVWGCIRMIIMGISTSKFSVSMFIAGAFTNAIPGITFQLMLVPAIVIALKKVRLTE